VQLRQGLNSTELHGWVVLRVLWMHKPAAGRPKCSPVVRGCIDYGDFGMSAYNRAAMVLALSLRRNLGVRIGAEGHDTSTKNSPRFEATGRRACRMPRGQAIDCRIGRHLPAVILDSGGRGVTFSKDLPCRRH